MLLCQSEWQCMQVFICNFWSTFEIATMTTKMTTQWSPLEKSMAISDYTLIINFSKIDPVVFPETCLQEKKVANNYKLPPWQQK